ncbi:hypothetical protein CYY_007928 [Polysphondylium violaceum]|uniref:Uncharacterized protein n=1 Tax=Polysphondylium violaceum TaxID=133409 RepID=A0A8J4PPJ0_9MYCE|nr:hypothetical protein CYY_007928 [Polysphondylium violaceum]
MDFHGFYLDGHEITESTYQSAARENKADLLEYIFKNYPLYTPDPSILKIPIERGFYEVLDVLFTYVNYKNSQHMINYDGLLATIINNRDERTFYVFMDHFKPEMYMDIKKSCMFEHTYKLYVAMALRQYPFIKYVIERVYTTDYDPNVQPPVIIDPMDGYILGNELH